MAHLMSRKVYVRVGVIEASYRMSRPSVAAEAEILVAVALLGISSVGWDPSSKDSYVVEGLDRRRRRALVIVVRQWWWLWLKRRSEVRRGPFISEAIRRQSSPNGINTPLYTDASSILWLHNSR